MTKKSKLLSKFAKTPTSLSFPQIELLLLHLGCHKIPAKGSHIKFKHPGQKPDLIIPVHNNECKQFYKKLARQFIKDLLL